MNGKQGVIDVTIGNPERIHKDKSGHLLIVIAFNNIKNNLFALLFL